MPVTRHLQIRDLEILRALARVHFLTSQQIGASFFSSRRRCLRRLERLRSLLLIRRHTNGAPPGTNYGAYRLAAAGLEVVAKSFPEEPLEDGLDEKLHRQSLFEFDHREALTGLYLSLLRGPLPEPSETPELVRQWSAAVRQRGDRLRWQADGVPYDFVDVLNAAHRLVPDAVVEGTESAWRVFVELDRSTKVLGRIEENFGRYASFIRDGGYRKAFSDDRAPFVLYVVRSERRREHITRLADDALGGVAEVRVVTLSGEAPRTLARLTLNERWPPIGDELSSLEPPERFDAQLSHAAERVVLTTLQLTRAAEPAFALIAQENPSAYEAWANSISDLSKASRE